jgi:hypothetical protein
MGKGDSGRERRHTSLRRMGLVAVDSHQAANVFTISDAKQLPN